MNLVLVRDALTADGVFGRLHIYQTGILNVLATFETMEDDWRNNEKGQSCIPAGTYQIHRTIFYKHGYEAFEVTGVPNRSRILIHIANTEEDVEGCIGIGLHRGMVRVVRDEDTGEAGKVKQAVTSSRQAFADFMRIMAGTDSASLTVGWSAGLP